MRKALEVIKKAGEILVAVATIVTVTKTLKKLK